MTDVPIMVRSRRMSIGDKKLNVVFFQTGSGTEPVRRWLKSLPVAHKKAIMKNKHIGTSFDDFLQEEGLLAAAEATAVKRVIAYEIEKEMEERHISKSALARMMQTSRSSLDRLLDPENASVTLLTMESAALALGRKLKVQLA